MEDFNNMEEMIEVAELSDPVLSQEVVEFVEVVEDDIYDIELDYAFPAVGEANEQNRHDNLMGRDEPDQHIITSISGLRDELDSIESLQTFYSDKRGRADYYLWIDGNIDKENRIGHFVSLSSETGDVVSTFPNSNIGKVYICNSEKIFGVVVSEAGFIGWQSDIERDHKYALITSDGIVAVRCETDVVVGDYVLSNYYGMAKKSDNGYGYKVVSIEYIGDVRYAVINLNASMEDVSNLAHNVSDIEKRVSLAEANITEMSDTITDIYNLALNGGGLGGSIPDNFIQDVNNTLQDTMNTVNSWSDQISGANSAAVLAQTVAHDAVSSANAIKEEAVSTANQALTTVNDEIAKIQGTVGEYKDNIDKNIQEFDGKIDDAISNVDNLVEKVEGLGVDINETTSKLDENSATIQNLAALIHSNYVGFRSRAYGLSTAQLDRVLDVGTIYVPIETHSEEYMCSEKSIDAEFYIYSVMGYSPAYGYSIPQIIEDKIIDDDTIYIPTQTHYEANIDQYFRKGYAYEWNGNGWTESETECVGFSNDSLYKYQYDAEDNKFYVDSEDTAFLHDGYIYQDFEKGYYYIWNGSEWDRSTKECVSFDKNIPNQEEYDYWYTDSNEIDGYNTETLYYYKNDKWVAVATLGENITHRIVNLIQQYVDENAAVIDLLVDYDKEQSEAIANIELKTDENSASIQNIASYTNKYAVGDVSPANGFTVEEANDYFISDVYYAPTDGHREQYGEVESIFHVGYLYTWNDNGWTQSETECVYHGGNIPTDVKHTHWYTGTDNVAEGYEKETLYLKEYDVWFEVAKLNGLITNAVASIRQKVNQNSSFIDLLANYKNKDTDATAGIIAAVSDHESKLDVLASYTYTDSYGQEHTNISSLIQQVDKNKADIESFAQYDGDIQDSLASIRQQADANGASIQALVASLDKYTVGKYSQAYGLTYELAKELVKIGSIFVPTESNLSESYQNGDETITREFTKGYYYEWTEGQNGNTYWYGHDGVYFSNTAPEKMNSYTYWFNTNTDEENGYKPEALYKWETTTNESGEEISEWKLVALLSDNSLSRAISSFRATQNSITASINDAKGDIASIDARITETESSIQNVVDWTSGAAETIAIIQSTADDAGASIAQVVESIGKDGEVSAASIVAAIESTSGDSIVQLKADYIDFTGFTTFAKSKDVYNTMIEYTLSDDETAAEDAKWSTRYPTWESGKYVLQRTTITYADENTEPIVTIFCIQGASEENVLSVFVTYHDGSEKPNKPTGDGISDGWHTDVTSSVVWMSQKVAESASSGLWSEPIKIKGNDGAPGNSVIAVTPQYYCSAETSSPPSDAVWKDSPEDWASGNTVFVRYKIDYTSGISTYTDAKIDETFTTISDWCSLEDKTLINGANIATGTISANQITTGTLQSKNKAFKVNLDTGEFTMTANVDVTSVKIKSDYTAFDMKDGTPNPTSITLKAEVSGTIGGQYTWYKNGVKISGATSSTCTIVPNDIAESSSSLYKVVYAVDGKEYFDHITISKTFDSVLFEMATDNIIVPVDINNIPLDFTKNIQIKMWRDENKMTYVDGTRYIDNDMKFYVNVLTNYFATSIITKNNSQAISLMDDGSAIPANQHITVNVYYSNNSDGSNQIVKQYKIAINTTKEDEILRQLSFIVDDEYGEITPASLILAINKDKTSEVKISADKISILGKDNINLNGVVTANSNFKINNDGSMETIKGKIGGWTIGEHSISSAGANTGSQANNEGRIYLNSHTSNSPYWMIAYDDEKAGNVSFYVQRNGLLYAKNADITGTINATRGSFSGTITAGSGSKIGGWTIGENELYSTRKMYGYEYKTHIQSALKEYAEDSWVFSTQRRIDGSTGDYDGLAVIKMNGDIDCKNLGVWGKLDVVGNDGTIIMALSPTEYSVTINGYLTITDTIWFGHDKKSYINRNGFYIDGTCVAGSRESIKKNFEKFEHGLSIVDDIDFYKYHLKKENDGDKKHIGFVIGDNFKYSSEITGIDENGNEVGADIYSMASLSLQCIKELKAIVEEQQKQIEELKKK